MSRIVMAFPSTRRVYLDNIGLADIDPAVYVRSVVFRAAQISTQTVARARWHGSHVTRQRVDGGSVQVTFSIREYGPAAYQDILRRVTAWAMGGGVMTTDDRPNQRLRVVCVSAPSGEGGMADECSMEFAAYDNPFWEDITPTTLILSGQSGSGQLFGPGSAADPFVEADVKPSGGTLTSLTLSAGNTQMAFSGLSVPQGKTFSLYYDKNMVLHAVRADTGAALLGKRSAASADDLMIPRGVFSTAAFTANTAASVTFRTRGLYL